MWSVGAALKRFSTGSASLIRSHRAATTTLRFDFTYYRLFATKDQARQEVAGYIDRYNHRHRHSSAEMLPPVAYEAVLVKRAAKSDEQDQAA